MSKINYKYWITTVLAIITAVSTILVAATDKELIAKNNKTVQWFILIAGATISVVAQATGSRDDNILTPANNNKPDQQQTEYK